MLKRTGTTTSVPTVQGSRKSMPTMKQPGERPRAQSAVPHHPGAGSTRPGHRTAQQELERARRLRADAERYHREMAVRARSEAQQLILKARLAVDREIAELSKKATEEIQRVLADIRVIRVTAQEELAAQRKFTDAARLCSKAIDLDHAEPAIPVETKTSSEGKTSTRRKKVHATASSK